METTGSERGERPRETDKGNNQEHEKKEEKEG
jgi:hypothetical protein